MAARSPGLGEEGSKELPAHALAACRLGRHKVVDIELEQADRRSDDPPAGDADAAAVVVGGREAKALRVALLVDGGEGIGREVGSQLTQDGKDVRFQPLIAGFQVDQRHGVILARRFLGGATMSERTRELGRVWDLMADTSFGSRAPLY